MVKRKIYDITPPRKQKRAPSIPVAKDESSVILKKKTKNSFGSKKIVFLCILVLFAVIGFWFFSSANKVIIEIKPTIKHIVLDTSVSFSTSTKELDLSKIGLSEIVMPTQEVKIEKDFRKEFPASLISVEDKAHGVIQVHNKHNRMVSLVKGTRFLSSTKPAKLFYSSKKISIPAGGYVNVFVEASESGDSYNIEPCAFSIPGLRNFSPPQLYYDVVGKSVSKMQGGRIEKIHKITNQDLQQAQTAILKSANQEAKQILQDKVGSDFVIIDKSINLKSLGGTLVNASIGQEVSSFVYQLKSEISGLKVKEKFLADLGKRYVDLNILSPMKAVEDKIKINFVAEDSKELTSDIEIQADIYKEIDQRSLKEIIKGRRMKDISRYVLEVAPYLDGPPKIIFKPFWARKATSDMSKIEVKMDF